MALPILLAVKFKHQQMTDDVINGSTMESLELVTGNSMLFLELLKQNTAANLPPCEIHLGGQDRNWGIYHSVSLSCPVENFVHHVDEIIQEWKGMAKDGWQSLRIAKDGQGWQRMAKDGWQWLRMANNGKDSNLMRIANLKTFNFQLTVERNWD